MDTVGQAPRTIKDFTDQLRWLRQGVRLPFLAVSFIPALLAGASAWAADELHFGRFVPALLAVLFLHAGANLWNDYFDDRSGTDRLQTHPTPYSGGSRVIQNGLLSPAQVKGWALLFAAAGGFCGVLACLFGSVWSWFFLGGGFLIGWGYSAPPVRWIGHGWGEAALGLAFGPLLTGGVYLTQTSQAAAGPFLVSFAMGLLVTAVLCVNEIPDRETDRNSGKYTLAVRLSEESFETMIASLIGIAFLSIVLGWTFGILPRFSVIAFLCLPMGIRIVRQLPRVQNGDLRANKMMINLTVLFGLILIIAFISGRWTS